jgi:Uma2 family endonuclease
MTPPQLSAGRRIIYPETDGQPMAENTLQFRWIVTLEGGFDVLFRGRPDVFVAGDLFWYPVEGDNKTRAAPDVMVAFGRPKGDRRSYLQWCEGNIPPQVVFEVLSPGNTASEMVRKFQFYERYGVEEYYVYDPDNVVFEGWIREGGSLKEVPHADGWVSPRLGVRFELSGGELRVLDPSGRPFPTFLELSEQAEQAQQRAEEERRRAEEERRRAEEERARAASERVRAERLDAQLRALGVKPEA